MTSFNRPPDATLRRAEKDLAYAAALIDTLGHLRVRELKGVQLPMVALHGTFVRSLEFLANLTGTKVTHTERDYHRGACAEHCPEPHTHVTSKSARWSVSGARATILLHNLLPYLRVQREEALQLIEVGKTVGYKGQVVVEMRQAGWEIPELKPQPRARLDYLSGDRIA